MTSKSVFRRLNVQMGKNEMACFLAGEVSLTILEQAVEIAIGQEIMEKDPPVHIWADGWCKGNGQPGAIAGWSLKAYRLGSPTAPIRERQGLVDMARPQTNNVAEYYAVWAALRLAKNEGWDNVTVYSDSALVVGHLTQGWKVKATHLQELHHQVAELLVATGALLVRVPREDMVKAVGH